MIYPVSSHDDLVSPYQGHHVALLQEPQTTMQMHPLQLCSAQPGQP